MVRDSAACLNAADSGVESVVGGFSLGLGAWAGPGCTGWQAWYADVFRFYTWCHSPIVFNDVIIAQDIPTVNSRNMLF